MILRSIAGALALVCVLAFAMTSTDAKPRHHQKHERFGEPYGRPMTCDTDGRCTGGGSMPEFSSLLPVRGAHQAEHAAAGAGRIIPHPAGCPARLFCGCGAAVRIFGAPIRSLWLAANWLRFPQAEPAPGMAAVRQHHVFVIERVLSGGQVVAFDANSGRGVTQIHVRSLAGYRVVNPRGG